MTVNNIMKYEVYTLIDVTETLARFNKNDPDWHRQQNYMTFLQTVGLRANPIIDKGPLPEKINITNLGFGKKYKGQHNVWHFEFELDFSTIDYEILVNDFDLVPIISGLSETIKLEKSVFETKDADRINLIFKCID